MEPYDYFVSKKVAPVLSPKRTALIVLKAEVRPGKAESQRDLLLPWVIAKENGQSIPAPCDCKADYNQSSLIRFLILSLFPFGNIVTVVQ